MVLACDIGNSRIKAGIFTNNILAEVFVCNSVPILIDMIQSHHIREVAISSVVPANTKDLQDTLEKLDIFPFIITKDSDFNLCIDYNTQETLGMDRICSAEGAYFLNNQKRVLRRHHLLVTIDFGTATTFNVVTYPGVFAGGIIAPGIDMMFRSLNKETAQLPLVFQNDFNGLIGKSTRESIASGVLNSAAGLIDRTLRIINEEFKPEKVHIYITGGNFESIKPFLDYKYMYKEALVLYGINAIFNKSKTRIETI